MSGLRSIAVFALRRPRLSGARSSCPAASAGSISSTSSISDRSRKACSSSTSDSSRSISDNAVVISANVEDADLLALEDQSLDFFEFLQIHN